MRYGLTKSESGRKNAGCVDGDLNTAIASLPSGKAQAFDACIALVRIQQGLFIKRKEKKYDKSRIYSNVYKTTAC